MYHALSVGMSCLEHGMGRGKISSDMTGKTAPAPARRTNRNVKAPRVKPTQKSVPAKTAVKPAVPAPGEGKRGEDGYLGYLLRQAQGAARLSLERAGLVQGKW